MIFVKEIYAVLCPPDASMRTTADMRQCQQEGWVPIATYTQDGQIMAICFTDEKIARKFMKRNYPKNWLRGVISLTNDELDWMKKEGWKTMLISYPKMMKDLPGFGCEVLEFQSKPDLFMVKVEEPETFGGQHGQGKNSQQMAESTTDASG